MPKEAQETMNLSEMIQPPDDRSVIATVCGDAGTLFIAFHL